LEINSFSRKISSMYLVKAKLGDWENYIMRRLICILFIKQQMGRACSAYKETEKCIQNIE